MARFDDCLAFILSPNIEGGYSNDPSDHGGATNGGVTQATYDGWRKAQGLPLQPVNFITRTEEAAIYQTEYWTPAHCGQLPQPVDLCVFDAAVNSGPHKSQQLLQEAIGATPDGNIGPNTLAAVAAIPSLAVATQYCDQHEHFYRSIVATDPTQARFLAGWLNRVDTVRTACGISAN